LSVEALASRDGHDARALRRKLEALNVQADPTAVDFAWPYLGSKDRHLRYAARLAVERNPIEQWQARALAEKSPDAALTALLALARLGNADSQPALLQAVTSLSSDRLTEEQLLNKLRVIQVSLARNGVPAGESAARVLADVDPLYPAASQALNRELCQILVAMNAPHVVSRTMALLEAAKTQEEQITYVVHLRNVKSGWDAELRRKYLAWWNGGQSTGHPAHVVRWFAEAGIPFNNGASFAGFMAAAHEEAKFTMTPDEIVALSDVLAAYGASRAPEPAPSLSTRSLVKEWTTADLLPALNKVSSGRNFERGREVFYKAQCSACHRYGDQGGAIGPDLTAVSTRFKRQDLLEAVTEPSKVVSEQYANTALETSDGRVIVGRIADETPEQVVIRPNPLTEDIVAVLKSDIERRELSKASPMPTDLLNTFTEEEILDLLAYMESLGDPKHPNFSE
jgi:putative heme-binding domain-containing protein